MPEQLPRGLADDTVEPRFLVIGRVVKPHGVNGEVRVEIHTDLPERFGWLDSVYIGRDDLTEMAIEGVRFHKSWVLLKLAGYDDRDQAGTLRSQLLQIPEELGLPLEEGQYYLHQILNFDVFTESNQHLGRVVEVMETKANNVFVVDGELGEVLLPDIEDVIREIDFEQKRISVQLMPGLLNTDY